MRLPSIYSNGTSRKALADSYVDACAALQRAIDALVEASPNARDYYVQGDGAFDEAAKEHRARIGKLADVLTDLQELYRHVVTGGGTD